MAGRLATLGNNAAKSTRREKIDDRSDDLGLDMGLDMDFDMGCDMSCDMGLEYSLLDGAIGLARGRRLSLQDGQKTAKLGLGVAFFAALADQGELCYERFAASCIN